MSASKVIRCGGSEVRIHGDPDDPYFAHAQVHADGLAPLGRQAASQGPGLALDIGCNIGLSTVVLARARPGDTVIAADPSPMNIGFLRETLAANALQNVEVVEAAVSDRPGALRLHVHGAWSFIVGAAHLQPDSTAVPVPVTTLDALAAGRGQVAFVKIDTEGHEPHVLAGGRTVLERDRPLMLMEFHSWCLAGVSGASPAAFARALWDRFTVRRMLADGQVGPEDETAHDFLHGNMAERGLVDDLLLRLREGARVPTLAEFMLPAGYAAELARLHAENAALTGSTSWRVTAPLRRLATLLRPPR